MSLPRLVDRPYLPPLPLLLYECLLIRILDERGKVRRPVATLRLPFIVTGFASMFLRHVRASHPDVTERGLPVPLRLLGRLGLPQAGTFRT